MAIEKARICRNQSSGTSGLITRGTRSTLSRSSLMSTDTRARRRGSTPSARLNYSSFARLTEMPIAIIGLLVPTTRVPEQRETTPRPTLTTRLRKSSGGKMQPPTFRNSMNSSSLPSRPAQRSSPRASRRTSNRYHAQSGCKRRRLRPQAHLRGRTPPRDRHHLDPLRETIASIGFSHGLGHSCRLSRATVRGKQMCAPECLADDLDVKLHSPDFVSMGVVEELLSRLGYARSPS